jgi:hypothetical protein
MKMDEKTIDKCDEHIKMLESRVDHLTRMYEMLDARGELPEWKWGKLEGLLQQEFDKGREHASALLYNLINTMIDNTGLDTFEVVGLLETSKAKLIDPVIENYRKNDWTA